MLDKTEICDFDTYDISLINQLGIFDEYKRICCGDSGNTSRYRYFDYLGDNALDPYTCRKADNFQLIGIPTIDNTDMKGERYKTSRLSNTNLDSLENLKYKVDLNSTIVNIVKEQLESDVFTINKQYFIKNKTDNTNIPSGRYLLSTKKEIYVKDAESFNMTSIFSFKKCPST